MGKNRMPAVCRLVLLCAFLACVAMARGASAQANPQMKVHFIDVGQGDATLFEFECGAILVDVGGELHNSFSGREALMAYLERFFLDRPDLDRRLDALYLTHPHVDHTRAVPRVVGRYRPRNIITNGFEWGSGKSGQMAAHNEVDRRATNDDDDDDVGYRAIRVSDIPPGGLTDEVIDPIRCEDSDPQISVLWGQMDEVDGVSQTTRRNGNNHSIVVRVAVGDSSVMLTGDLEEDAIDNFLEHHDEQAALDVDVYQAGHHGSANGTTPELLRALTPEAIVISMGREEREVSWSAWAYGHPRRSVVQLFADRDINPSIRDAAERDVRVARAQERFVDFEIDEAIYATGWDGDVVLTADGEGSFRLPVLPTDAPPAKLDLNSATLEQLDALPHIGPARAAAIRAHIGEHGPFTSVQQLLDVRGIGPATYEIIRDLVEVGAPEEPASDGEPESP